MPIKTWPEAFLAQSKSDLDVIEYLKSSSLPDCHRFHYLQMAGEKLGKAMLSGSGNAGQPKFTHAALVRSLQLLKANPRVREYMGFKRKQDFKNYIDSLLQLAAWIENLAPSRAGRYGPNPEYPWEDRNNSSLIAPTEFDFVQCCPGALVKIPKLVGLLRSIAHNGL